MSPLPPSTALVTGGARRIGRAIALGLAQAGWAVAIHYNRSEADAQALVAEIAAGGGRAAAVRADLLRRDQVAALIGDTADLLGPVICLINNASVFEHDSTRSVSDDTWDRHMAVNLRAPFFLTQDFARRLPAGERGAVVNILDQRVWNLTSEFVSYTVSKAALWTLTRTTAMALAPRVRVNAIGPGPTLPSHRQTDAAFARQWGALPLARPTPPEEIAAAVRFILDAPAMTGQMIALDGGQHLGWAQPSKIEQFKE